jgi:hypothetical protein
MVAWLENDELENVCEEGAMMASSIPEFARSG